MLTGSPSAIITLGLSNGTFNGSVGLMLTCGLGAGEAVAAGTLVGQWANVIQLYSSNKRLEIYSSNERLEL